MELIQLVELALSQVSYYDSSTCFLVFIVFSFCSACLASCRMYSRSFLKTFDQPTQHLIRLMIGGIGPETAKPHKMTDFLLTTRWRPKPEHVAALQGEGFVLNKSPCNNALEDIEQLYKELVPDNKYKVFDNHGEDEYTPFYWSSGLIMHPKVAEKSYNYIVKHNLQKAHNIGYIPYFGNAGVFEAAMKSAQQFSRGQMYCGIKLNLYRKPSVGLVMSSLDLFNPHVANFQQMPWMINLNGIPMWSKCGPQEISVAGIKIPFEVNNLHGPAAQQDGDTLLVTYITPPNVIDTRSLYSNTDSRVFWPSQFLTSICTIPLGASSGGLKKSGESGFDLSLNNQWIIGQRNQIFVAILCTQAVKLDTSSNADSKKECTFTYLDATGTQKVTEIPRLICSKRGHSWVIVVGTITNALQTIQDFIDQRLQKISVEEHRDTKKEGLFEEKFKYDITVTDSTRPAGSLPLKYTKEM
jgi:hypothetical protein